MTMYTLETLKEINGSYDFHHRVTMEDVENVNAMITAIENSRTPNTPQVGDVVEFITKYGDYYGNAHIDNVEGDMLNICERPSYPFVSVRDDDSIYTSTSGGAWANIPANIMFVGKKQKMFKVWGHKGWCGDGAIVFLAQVNVWSYTEGNPEFTTKTHDKYHVSIREDAPDGYRFIIRHEAMSHTAFRTKEEYQAWLDTYHGTEFSNGTNNKIVWTFKQVSECIPLEDYLNLQGAVIDSDLCNGAIQQCKRYYQGTTVTTYLPYQNDKIKLEGVKQYMRVAS